MFTKKFIINIILGAVLAFFSFQTYQEWFGTASDVFHPQGKRAARSKRPPMSEKLTPRKMPRESAYQDVVDLNLFSPQRQTVIEEEEEKKEKKSEPEVKTVKVSGKKIILYGVVLTDTYRAALINNPLRKAGDRKDKWVQLNETIGQLKVKDIQSESLILADGGDLFEIPLYGQDERKRRNEGSQSSTPTVVTAGSKPESPQPRSKAVKASQNAKADESEYEIIDTPFGKVKRKKK